MRTTTMNTIRFSVPAYSFDMGINQRCPPPGSAGVPPAGDAQANDASEVSDISPRSFHAVSPPSPAGGTPALPGDLRFARVLRACCRNRKLLPAKAGTPNPGHVASTRVRVWSPGFSRFSLARSLGNTPLRLVTTLNSLVLAGLILTTAILTVTSAQEPVRQFDFGTPTSPVQAGFDRIHAGTTYDKAIGYGWDKHEALKDTDKTDADNLKRDFCFGYASRGAQAAHFLVDLQDGKYWAAFFAGDIQYSRSETPMDILISGAKVVDGWRVHGWDWRVAEMEVKGGQADIVFQSSQAPGQRYSFWLINALVIYRGGTKEAALAKAAQLSSSVQEAHLLKQFKEQIPDPSAKAAPVTVLDRKRGYVPFARLPVNTVLPNTLPTAAERRESLRAFCTPGAWTHVTFGIAPLQDLGECAVSVSDLKCGRHTIPAAAWQTHLARISRERVGGSRSKTFRWQPKVLDPTAKAPIPAGQTRWWWLTLRMPDEQPAGLYTGTVTFAPQDGPKHTFSVVLRVYPFKLREPPGEVFGMYWGRRYVLYPQTIRQQFADLRAHGCNGITLDVAPNGGFDAQGKLQLDFSEMDEIIKLAQEAGLTSPIPWHGAGRIPSMLAASFESDLGRERYKQIVAAIVAHAKQAGWPPILFYPVDEPPKEQILKYLPLIKEVPGALTYCTPNNISTGLATVHTMDYACWQQQSANDATRAATQAAGRTFWFYSSNYGEDSQRVRLRSGFFRWRMGATGMFYWHYQAPHGDPFNALDAVADHCVAFPTPDGLLPSIGWEGQREGQDDYRYAKMLEWLIERAGPKSFAARSAQATLDKLRAEIPGDGKKLLESAETSFLGSFDIYRDRIANHIIALLKEVR